MISKLLATPPSIQEGVEPSKMPPAFILLARLLLVLLGQLL